MNWQRIREHYPKQWLLIEAVKARSEGRKRILEQDFRYQCLFRFHIRNE